ncbi:amidohydrolase family protein [Microbispora cellulosiformans]|uniref:Amidohydrolase family protein n=1 Tax=Microbispora cellulosiformans TaxID=2614688 RepID=A0A5J5K330_9ACTN|nr:amidohydrolase family protein [Microbispora cellulosiformans]KAA9377655.1 amidohydrolase family protein [Microbispora cellulosiformans]
MSNSHQPFTITGVRVFGGGGPLPGVTHVRVSDGRIAGAGDASVARPGDVLVDGSGATLLPGLVDAHVHLLPGCTRLAAGFGVTTVLDMFSKPETIVPERAAVAASEAGRGPVRADMRTSGVGATAPGGHPTVAYAPFPYVTGPRDAASFVADRVAEGATYLKVIYDDGSGAMLDIPALDVRTIEALVAAAHGDGLPVVAHASTSAGAVTVARCGVDVLAHVPFDRMTDGQVRDVARCGVAVITTLGVLDGFPGRDGVMPLLARPRLAGRLGARWRRVVERQATRWMPPEPPDGAAQRYNTVALLESGLRLLAGTDVPNPGLVFGASLHRELWHLVEAGLAPAEALTAATSAPAGVFGLADRGEIAVGRRADLVLVDGDPAADITATERIRDVWVLGRRVDHGAYSGGEAEREGVRWQRESTERIVQAITETWPGLPGPEEVRREDGEILGRVVPTSGGWQAVTVFGAPLGRAGGHDEAVAVLHDRGLACLAEPWWARAGDDPAWRRARIVEAAPGGVRLRWDDPLADQPPSGRWFGLDDLDLSLDPPEG